MAGLWQGTQKGRGEEGSSPTRNSWISAIGRRIQCAVCSVTRSTEPISAEQATRSSLVRCVITAAEFVSSNVLSVRWTTFNAGATTAGCQLRLVDVTDDNSTTSSSSCTGHAPLIERFLPASRTVIVISIRENVCSNSNAKSHVFGF